MNKKFAAVAVLFFIGLIALAYAGGDWGFANGRRPSPTSSAPEKSTAGNANSLVMGISVVPTPSLVPTGGSANFTLVLGNGNGISGTYSLSAATPSGLSLAFDPSLVNLSDCVQCYVNLLATEFGATQSGTVQATVEVSGPEGRANQTVEFQVQRNLVLFSARDVNRFTNLTIKAGETVIWVGLDGPFSFRSEADTFHQVVFLNSAVRSSLLSNDEQWSYTFREPGVYRYYDNAFPTTSGEIVVTA